MKKTTKVFYLLYLCIVGFCGEGLRAQNCTPISVIANPTVICSGSSSTLTASGSGGTTYSWSTGNSGAVLVVTPSVTTTYTVTGTKGNCTDTKTVMVTVNPGTTVMVSASTNSICRGSSSTLTASGANSFTWSPSGSLSSNSGSVVIASPLVTTVYSVTGSTSGCTNTKTISISVTPVPTVNVSANTYTICSGQSTTLSASGASSFSWTPGASLNATTGAVVVASPTITTSYTVTGTTNSCTDTETIQITVNQTPVISVNSGSICAGESFTIVPSGASSYTFEGGSAVVSPTNTTSYTVTGTSAEGCVSAAAVSSVTVNALPVITVNSGSICAGESFTIVPSGASSYTFEGGSAVVSPTTTTSYTVTGTSAEGCVSAAAAVSSVTVNALPVITVNSGSICAGESFTIVPSGASSYTFEGGSAVVSPTTTTSYTVTGTSAEGCVSAAAAVSSVTVNALPVITVNSGSICAGESFTIVPSGASSYTFEGGSAVVSPTTTTSYTVTGTSAEGCVSAAAAVSSVTVNALPVITVNSGSICAGESFTIVPSGASSYTFEGGSAVVSPTTTTSYTVTGTSAEGCVSAAAAVSSVTVNALPVVTAVGSQTVNLGYAPMQCATITGTATGATMPYQFVWTPGGNGQSTVVCPTVTTVYTLSVTDANGCTGVGQTTVVVKDVRCDSTKVVMCYKNETVCVSQNDVLDLIEYGATFGPCGIAAGIANSSTTDPEKALVIYPNPNNGMFQVEVCNRTISEKAKMEITNSLGQIVFRNNVNVIDGCISEKIDFQNELQSGIYIVTIKAGKYNLVAKMILTN